MRIARTGAVSDDDIAAAIDEAGYRLTRADRAAHEGVDRGVEREVLGQLDRAVVARPAESDEHGADDLDVAHDVSLARDLVQVEVDARPGDLGDDRRRSDVSSNPGG